MKEALSMWTVYDHPTDFPGGFIARCWLVDGASCYATEDVVTAQSLDEVRKLIPPEFSACLARAETDDPKIVEVWL